MMQIIGYAFLAFALIAVVGIFVKVLIYALDVITKNDD
jgi:hypothetical protein